MTAEAIAALLKETFPEGVTEVNVAGAHPHVVVTPDAWPRIARFLRDDPRLKFDWLRCISGVDYLEDNLLAAVYDFHSTQVPNASDGSHGAPRGGGLWSARHEFAVKVKVPRDRPNIPSVSHLWAAADWHEREAYDLLGIVFDGHPDSVEGPDGPHPRRILCPDDWVGHPLRKDYEFPLEYHGIPAVTEMEQTRPQH